MTSSSAIVALGHYLPPRKVPNAELPVEYEVDAAGIEKRTGIRCRYYAEKGVYTSDLAKYAAEDALTKAAMSLQDIDCIITATLSPDYCFPGIGTALQTKMNCAYIPAYDVRNQCSGFLYALNSARAFVGAGIHQNVLVVGAELHSHALGHTQMHSHITPLFGDGAAAVVVSPMPPPKERNGICMRVDYARVYADGSGGAKLRQRVWDISQQPFMDWRAVASSAEEMWYAEMDGQYVFRRAVKEMSKAARMALQENNLTLDAIDLVIAHQANLNINNTVASILGIDEAKMPANIQEVGNTTAASIPLLMSQLREAGRIQGGQKLMLLAFGSGLTWGAAILTVL